MNLRTFSRCFPGFYRKCFFPPGILGQVTRNAARLGHVSKRAPLRRGGRGQPGQGRHGFIATNRKAPNRFRKLNSNHSNPKLSANSTYFAFLRLLHCNITLKKLNIWFSWVLNVDEESVVFTSFILARQSWSPSIHCTETWLLGTGGPGGGGQQVTLAQCPFHFVYRWFWNMGISHCHVWLPVDSDIRMIQQDELGCPWWSRFLLCLFWLLTLCVPARTATPLGTTQHVVKGAVWRCSWTAASWVVLKGGTSLRRGRAGMRYRNLATACPACPACHGSWLQIHTMGKQPRQSSPCGLGSAPSWTKWSRTHQRWHCGRIWPYATRSTGLSDLVVPAIPMDYHQFQMDSW